MRTLSLVFLLLCVCSNGLFAETRPHYAQIIGTPVRCVSEFGVKGDGITDDTVALQAAVNSGKVAISSGVYLVSSAISIPSNSGLIALNSGTWSPSATKNVTLKYIGATGADTAVLKISAYAVGITSGVDARSNAIVKGITVDGNDLAAYGIWGYYMTNESSLEDVTVINTNTSGISLNGNVYYNKFSNLTARNNNGNGIVVGVGANANTFYGLRASTNGTSKLEADYEANAGIVLKFTTRNSVIGITSENNAGPGVYLGCFGSVNKLSGIYVEGNNLDGVAPVGVYIDSKATSRCNVLEDIWLAGAVASTAQVIIASGSEDGQYLISNFRGSYFGEVIFDNTNGALSLKSPSPGGLGNALPYSVHNLAGTVYVGAKLKVHAYSSTTDNIKNNIQSHAFELSSVTWATDSIQIATFSVRFPNSSRGNQATFNFALGFNEYTAGSTQVTCLAEGVATIIREGTSTSTAIGSNTLLLSHAINQSGGLSAANILATEITFSVVSGGTTDTQQLGMFFTRSNNATTYTNMSISLSGLLKDASTGTPAQGVGLSFE